MGTDIDVAGSDSVPADFSLLVGERLRGIRRQKKMSLQDVELASDQEFKASVLGAYERGERAISVPRLQRLARFYAVPVDQLLPRDDSAGFEDDQAMTNLALAEPIDRSSFTIDLSRLDALTGPEAEMIGRFISSIQVERQDFNGRVLTIRRDDLRAIACILGIDPEMASRRLAASTPHSTGNGSNA